MRKLKLILAFFTIFISQEKIFAESFIEMEVIQPKENLANPLNNRYYKAYPGIEYEVPVGVLGGKYPFMYRLVSHPNGMVIDSLSGIITWPDPVISGSPHQVTVQVTDSDIPQNSVSVSWTIEVTTEGFVFVDAENGRNNGAGTIDDPLMTLGDVYGEAYTDNTYDDFIMYLRGGTYDPEGYFENSGQQYQLEWRPDTKPTIWIGYPGEQVIIDHDRTASGAFFDMTQRDCDDAYFQNIKFQDMLNHAIRIGGNRVVVFKCVFENLGPGVDGANSSFFMTVSGGTVAVWDNLLMSNNIFDTCNNAAFVKMYNIFYSVIENNVFTNGSGGVLEGLALKADCNISSVRSNYFNNIYKHVIGGNWNRNDDMEICFNVILNARSVYNERGDYGALTVNYNNSAGPHYIYRNTMQGNVVVRFADASDGPFYFSKNVIVNDNSGVPVGSHITQTDVEDASRIQIDDNLVGYSSDNIIDENGNLTAEYEEYIGTHGHVIGNNQSIPPPQPVQGLKITR